MNHIFWHIPASVYINRAVSVRPFYCQFVLCCTVTVHYSSYYYPDNCHFLHCLDQFCVKLCPPLTFWLTNVCFSFVFCLLSPFCLLCCRPVWLRLLPLLLLLMLPTIANPAARKPTTANIWSTTHGGRPLSSHPLL